MDVTIYSHASLINLALCPLCRYLVTSISFVSIGMTCEAFHILSSTFLQSESSMAHKLPSDVRDIGHSNRVYSEEEICSIKDFANGMEGEILRLDDMIARLYMKRESFVRELDRCRVALAPHRMLPTDILRYIFLLCVEEDAGQGWIPIPLHHMSDPPIQIILSHVCSFWRQVALNTTGLWNKLTVCEPYSDFWDLAPATEFLSRSKGARVSLSIHRTLSPCRHKSLQEHLASLVDSLRKLIIGTKHLYEFHLDLEIDHLDQLRAFFTMDKVIQLLRLSPPGLTTLGLHLGGRLQRENVAENWDQVVDVFNYVNNKGKTSFPSLESLHMSGAEWFYKGIYHQMPWERLRSLSLDGISPNWALAILHKCPSLETCTLELILPNGDPELSLLFGPGFETEALHIPLPHLRHLRLSFYHHFTRPDIHSFLRPLALPNLKSLCYIEQRGPYDPHVTGIWPINTDAVIEEKLQLDKLEELEVYPRSSFVPDKLLRKACNLRRFHTHSYGILHPSTVSGLGSGVLGPKLQDVYIEGQQDAARMLRMIEERQNSAAATMRKYEEVTLNHAGVNSSVVLPFKRFGFKCSPEDIQRRKDWSDALRGDGLELSIYPVKQASRLGNRTLDVVWDD
ncbi:hypothetical protein AMATHDRAFT_50727 [Amanita thiersii Skay4041]|uniref:Uncharacterized protein n=1 Tax=Amanita thiersii Skay4041 TaxID=703135 RepID=A0A2A9NGM9_9AGAR|nr:hypothetical protein AMATHDRAFT_50727 [Amanita thiersii Skay4041]